MKSAKFQMSSPITYSFLFLSKTEWYSLSIAFWYSSLNIRGGSYSQGKEVALNEVTVNLSKSSVCLLPVYLGPASSRQQLLGLFIAAALTVTISNYWNRKGKHSTNIIPGMPGGKSWFCLVLCNRCRSATPSLCDSLMKWMSTLQCPVFQLSIFCEC